MKSRKLIAIPVIIAIVLAALIYWREYELREQIPIYSVFLWQLGIWLPWIPGFMLLETIINKVAGRAYKSAIIVTSCIILISLHFGWFFFLSSNLSPYLGQVGSRFGVFRYFFVFWTLIDLGVVWFFADKFRWGIRQQENAPLLLELTRGKSKYLCKPSQVYLLASENYYTKLFTSEGIFIKRKPLKYFQDVLPKDVFKRIHRSTIINVNQVSELVKGIDHKLEVIMKDGTRKRVSRNYVREITLFFKDRTS